MVKILFVCMGNICRSPTAEGVFRHLVEQAGVGQVGVGQASTEQASVEDEIFIDSAGTHAYHVGNPPDPRAQDAALKRNIDLSNQRARSVSEDDFAEFDYVIAMDKNNKDNLLSICPAEHSERVHLLLDFAECEESEVPDPYYGQGRGFEIVLDLVEEASSGLLKHIQEKQ